MTNVSGNNFTMNSSSLSAYQSLEEFRYYTVGVILTPISIFGILGNILSIFVLSCPEMKSNFNQLLICLASFDLVYLQLSFAIFAMPTLSVWYTETLFPYIMPIGVTIERFVAIAYPMRKTNLKNSLIMASVFGSIVYNLPRFFELEMVQVDVLDPETKANVTVNRIAPTELRFNKLYVQIYVVWMKFFLVELLPYVIICVLNFVMIVKIREAMKLQKEMTISRQPSLESQKKEFNMALVLVCIVFMFIACQSIKIIPDVYEAMVCDYSKTDTSCESTTTIERIVSISYVLLALNSASNFVIYMLRGNKFRRVLSRKLCQFFGYKPSSQFDSPRIGNSDSQSHHTRHNVIALTTTATTEMGHTPVQPHRSLIKFHSTRHESPIQMV
ncbi:hypothetical protein TCAL_03401 [Tigriopus californicus]|uniref:G-protein coupled receptors family 1 profile domain-containing protein n=1 Tax=Tigriopus californicus TaxID=6832 RepID=A0A553P2C8_TIGCA|nr:hypothetical protein TCAL_03401 [Tigriopus californicus]